MRRFRRLLIFVVPVLLAGVFLVNGGYRFRTRRFNVPSDSNVHATPEQLAAMCAKAILPLPRVRPGMTENQLAPILQQSFNATVAATIIRSYRDRRVMPSQGRLFFYSQSLCAHANLPGDCSTLCAEYQRFVPR